MTDTKFSKSPWMVTPQGPADANGMGICSMWGDGEELIANVDLISQAPAMYKLLQKFLPMDEDGNGEFQYNDGSEELGEEVIKLLSKARGE